MMALCRMRKGKTEVLSLFRLLPIVPETSVAQPGPPSLHACLSVWVEEGTECTGMEHARGHEGGDQRLSIVVSTGGLMACVHLDGSQRAIQSVLLPGSQTAWTQICSATF